MKTFAEVMSTLSFIGLGFCIGGACLDYFDWLVAVVMFVYLAMALVFKYLAKSIDN